MKDDVVGCYVAYCTYVSLFKETQPPIRVMSLQRDPFDQLIPCQCSPAVPSSEAGVWKSMSPPPMSGTNVYQPIAGPKYCDMSEGVMSPLPLVSNTEDSICICDG